MTLLTIDAIEIVNTALAIKIMQAKELIRIGVFNVVTISTKQISLAVIELLDEIQRDVFKSNDKVLIVKSSTLIGHEYFSNDIASKPEYSYYGMMKNNLRTLLNEYGIKLPNNSEISKLIENIDSSLSKFNNIFAIDIGTDYYSTRIILNQVSPVMVSELATHDTNSDTLINSYHFYNLTNNEAYTFTSTKQRNAYLKTKADLELRKIL